MDTTADSNDKELAIIFHSGSFDRVYHGFSIALSALALGRDVKFFFTYWTLEYLKIKGPATFNLDKEGEAHTHILEDNIRKGHMHRISEIITEAKVMGAKLYVCTSSMGLLNISRDELIDQVDMSMGITTFLTETSNAQILFI